eukprot:193457-Alexandrium_andersonii.AAC.1
MRACGAPIPRHLVATHTHCTLRGFWGRARATHAALSQACSGIAVLLTDIVRGLRACGVPIA